jgi:hypothetical protein
MAKKSPKNKFKTPAKKKLQYGDVYDPYGFGYTDPKMYNSPIAYGKVNPPNFSNLKSRGLNISPISGVGEKELFPYGMGSLSSGYKIPNRNPTNRIPKFPSDANTSTPKMGEEEFNWVNAETGVPTPGTITETTKTTRAKKKTTAPVGTTPGVTPTTTTPATSTTPIVPTPWSIGGTNTSTGTVTPPVAAATPAAPVNNTVQSTSFPTDFNNLQGFGLNRPQFALPKTEGPTGPIRTYTPQERAQMDRYAKMSPEEKQKERDKYNGLAVKPTPFDYRPAETKGYPEIRGRETGPQSSVLNQQQTLEAGEAQSGTPKAVKEAQELSKKIEPEKSRQKARNPFENVKWSDAVQTGLYGVNAFLRRNDAIEEEQEFNRRLFDQDPIYNYNYLYGPDSSGGTQYQGVIPRTAQQGMIMAKEGAQIRKGTSPDITDVEVEGGEFIQLPNMNTQHVEGPSHANGGVHTNLPEGARVFSDFLKPAGSKKTYAQLAKKYDTQKWKDILENPYASEIDRNTAKLIYDRHERVLDGLFQDQQLQNGNSDGTDQAMDDMGGIDIQRTAQEGMIYESPVDQEGYIESDLKQILPPIYQEEPDYEGDMEIEPESDYNQGGQYFGGTAEFYGGGYFMDGGQFPMMGDNASTFYQGVMPDPSVLNTTNRTSGSPAFAQAGMQKTAATTTTTQGTPADAILDLVRRLESNPEFKQAFYQEYKKQYPNSPATVDEIINNFKTVSQHILTLREGLSETTLRDPELDKGKKNAKYKELAKQKGLTPLDETSISRFQAAYRSLADLKSNSKFATVLEDFNLDPKGVHDSDYLNKPISAADGWFGNTTIGELVAYALKQQTPGTDPETGKSTTPQEEPKPGSVMKPVSPVGQTMSTMGRFPAYQAIPNAMGYLSGLSPYSYYTPDFQPAYIAPPTLNIDPELQSIDDTVYAMMGQTTGNPSVDSSRDTALFNQALQAKQQAFARKQNYDANARGEADKFNALSAAEANNKNVLAAAQIKNEYMATSQDLAEAERLGAIFNLTDKYGKYQQDEYLKMLYFDSLVPNYYYNGLDPRNPIKLDPRASRSFEKSSVLPTTTTTTTTT